MLVKGFKQGGKYVVSGITDGVVGLVKKPIEGGKKGGVLGFFSGIGKGLVGGIVKPVVGLSNGVASIASGISQQVSVDERIVHCRPPRVLRRTHLAETDYILSPLNIEAAIIQNYVSSKNEGGSHVFLDYSVYDDTDGSAIILSESKMYIVHVTDAQGKKTLSIKEEQQFYWKNIQYFDVSNENQISIVLFNSSSETSRMPVGRTVILRCKDEESTLRTYGILFDNSHLVGNPTQMVSPKEVKRRFYFGSPSSSSKYEVEAVKEYWKVSAYKFGVEITDSPSGPHLSEQKIFSNAEEDFSGNSESIYLLSLDQRLMRLIHDWCWLNDGFNSPTCSVSLILNNTRTSIQIKSITMSHGKDYRCFGKGGYDRDSKSILPGGFVVIFAFGYPPSLMHNGHVKISISATAFTAIISTKQDSSFCESLLGYSTGFLEKTKLQNKKWSKYVLLITNS